MQSICQQLDIIMKLLLKKRKKIIGLVDRTIRPIYNNIFAFYKV